MDKPFAEVISNGGRTTIGIDIGGTNVKIGLVSMQGKLLAFQSFLLIKDVNGKADLVAIFQEIKQFVEQHQRYYQLSGVGIACPGILDTTDGIVLEAVNLGWEHVQLVERLTGYLQLPCQLVGDAAANALGETKENSDFMKVCIGTGIGAGLVKNNQLVQLSAGGVIDVGHMSIIPEGVPCKCGNKGCLECYVSANAIIEKLKQHVSKNGKRYPFISEVSEQEYPRRLLEEAKQGDVYARYVFQEAGKLLGIALVNCMKLFGVHHFIIGGGVSQAGEFLLGPARQEAANRVKGHSLSIKQSSIVVEAGVLGAAEEFQTQFLMKGGRSCR